MSATNLVLRRTSPRWTSEQEAYLRDNYAKRGSAELAQLLGISRDAVRQKACDMRLTQKSSRTKPRLWTPEMDAAIRDRYLKGEAVLLAKECGVARQTISSRARELGILNGKEVSLHRVAANHPSCNIKFFDDWSAEMAYILGFLFADGSISKTRNSVGVTMSSDDASVLDFIKRMVDPEAYLRHAAEGRVDPRSGSVNKPRSQLLLCSTPLVRSLERLGMRHRKTYNDDPFPEVPDNYAADFSRGYLDGDGCVSVSKGSCRVSIIGSPKFIEGLGSMISRLSGASTKRPYVQKFKMASCYVLQWAAKADLRKIYDFLYYHRHGFCFPRKKDRLESWLVAKGLLSNDEQETRP